MRNFWIDKGGWISCILLGSYILFCLLTGGNPGLYSIYYIIASYTIVGCLIGLGIDGLLGFRLKKFFKLKLTKKGQQGVRQGVKV